MKILLFISSLGSGGAERQLVNLGVLFKDAGHDVSFLVYHNDFFYGKFLEEKCIPVTFLESKNYIDRIVKVVNYIRSTNNDVVVSFLETPCFLASLAKIGYGQNWKLITTELSSKDSTFLTMKGRLFCYFRKFSDLIVCNSNNAMKKWESNYPNYKNKLKVIYNPVILPKISSQYIPYKNNKMNILIAASYQYLKNPIGLINALNLLSTEDKEKISVSWYGRKEITQGDSYAYQEALDLIEKYNLQEVIQLNDPTSDIANKMKEADIIGLFSELEGLPNAICEAMMIGKPIIMTKFSDYEILVDESNGFLCQWDDPISIKNALECSLRLNKENLIEMGDNSRLKAKKLFSKDLILSQWLSVFK